MRKQGNLLLRGLGVSVVALGLMGIGGASVSAQDDGVVCNLNPGLELGDANGDGTVSLTEVDRVIGLTQDAESKANLQSLRDQAAAEGITGIQYRGCDPDADPADPADPDVDQDAGDGTEQDVDDDTGVDQDTGDGTDQDAGDDGVDQDTGDGTDQDAGDDGVDQDTGDGTDDGADDGAVDENGDVTDLPETGVGQASDSNTSSMIMLGAGSLLAAAGAFTFRMKRA